MAKKSALFIEGANICEEKEKSVCEHMGRKRKNSYVNICEEKKKSICEENKREDICERKRMI